MTLLLRHWREAEKEQDTERGGEGKQRRGTDGETLRWTAIVFMHVCGHMYTRVSSMDAKKKVGQRISHHLLRGRQREEEKKERGQSQGKKKKKEERGGEERN